MNKELFKGARGARGARSNTNSNSILANSGLIAHTGAITQCSPTDNTFFCRISRLVSILQYLLFLIAIGFVIYYLVLPFLAKKLGFSRSGKSYKR